MTKCFPFHFPFVTSTVSASVVKAVKIPVIFCPARVVIVVSISVPPWLT
jgi:hypothetical protein